MTPASLAKSVLAGLLFMSVKAFGEEPLKAPAADSSSALGSVVRTIGALAIVFAIFFVAVWLLRNWQRLLAKRGVAARLNVLEAKSLGARQTLYVVAYERQRLLIASSPAGITMLAPLPEAQASDPVAPCAPAPAFSEILQKVLGAK